MPVGAGRCRASAVPAGYGAIDVAPAPVLVPVPDPQTGLPQTGRFVDQTTGDYTFTVDGRVQGMPTVYQLVLLAIERADVSSLTEKGSNYKQQVATILQNALSALVVAKQVEIKRVVVIDRLPGTNPDATVAVVFWKDLTTGVDGQPVKVQP